MIVFAEMSATMWIVILALAMLPIMSASKHRCERRGRFSVAGLLIFLIMMGGGLVYLLGARSALPEARWAYVLENGKPKLSDYAKASLAAHEPQRASSDIETAQTKSDPSLEVLWDRLTKSKIKLEAGKSEPTATPPDAVAQDAAKDTSPIDVSPKKYDVGPMKYDDEIRDAANKQAIKVTFGLDEHGQLPPSWVTTPPKWVGQVYRETVASEPFVTEEECRRNLEQVRLPQAVARRIENIASGQAGGKVVVTDPLQFGIGPDYILREIGREEFATTLDSSVGEMKEVHVLLEFDKNVDNYLLDAWLRHERQLRFASVSKVAALSLTGLAAIYGLLRFDTWSKGYYSRQLLVGGTLAIIALAVVLLKA